MTLPTLTLLVLAGAKWVTSLQLLIWSAVLVTGGVILWAVVRSLPEATRQALFGRLGGPFGRLSAVAQVATFTADLLEAGFDTRIALRTAAAASRKPRIEVAAERFLSRPANQERADEPYVRELTASVVHALRSEMPTTSRIRLLRTIGENQAERAGMWTSWTRGLAAPIAICAVGIVVGAIVLAMYVPLLNLLQNLGRSTH